MQGLKNLNDLSQEQKDAISKEFGSVEGLYRKVFDLTSEDYDLSTKKPENCEERKNKIAEELYDIEEKLDEMNISGDMIVSDISSDFGDIIVKRQIENLDNYLRSFGTNFENIRNWLRNNYNI